MNDNYKVIELMPGLWQITDHQEKIPTDVDMYLIEGREKALLVDAGQSSADLIGLVRKLTDKPLILVVTHGHGDHAAGMSQFEIVYMSHKDIEVLNDMFGFEINKSMVIDLKGGEVFDLGDRKIDVISLPGHTQGCVVLYDRERQLLFTGDSVGSGHIWIQLPHSTSIEAYIKELSKLEAMIGDKKEVRLLVGHSSQKRRELGMQYLRDIRTLAEKIVSGEVTGVPTMDRNEITGGLMASYGQMEVFVYKPSNIHIKH
jgi:glyoxylase-like metal-dependent hydrolase (beta-lactamase superfamily II)